MSKHARDPRQRPPDPSPRLTRRPTAIPTRHVPVDAVSHVLLGRYQVASALRRRSIRADEVLDYLEMIEELSEQD